MKNICYILAVYILAIALVPCDCNEVYHWDPNARTETAITMPLEQQLPPIDTCTPFCSCSYCAHFFFVEHDVIVLQPETQVTTPEAFIAESHESWSVMPLVNPPETVA